MATLRLRLSFAYDVRLAARLESEPEAHVWLTQSVSDHFETVSLDASGRGRVEREFVFPVRAEVLAHLGAAFVNVDAFVMMNNKHGERCLNQAGCSRVPLALLVGPAGVRPTEPTVETPLVYPMLSDEEGAVKGSVVFTLAGCALVLSMGAHVGADRLVGAETISTEWAVRMPSPSPLEPYIQHCEASYSPARLKPTWPALANIGLFRFVSRCGMSPAAGYVLAPLGNTKEEFFLNAARLALARMEVTEEYALTRWNPPATREHARLVTYWYAHAISLYSQYCDYIGDAVVTADGRTIDVEWFYRVRARRGAGDCEDDSDEQVIESNELEALVAKTPLVRLLQRVGANFYRCLMLDGVSAAEINERAMPGHMDAHMNAALINKGLMARWCPTLCKRHGPTADEVAAAMLYPPIVMLEGTGPLDPNGVEHAEADADAEEITTRVCAGHRLLVARLRQMFHYRSDGKKQSPFYKVVKIASTPQLAYRGCGQLLFMALMASEGTAGVPFQDIAAASDRITFVPQLELSEPQLAEMRTYLLDLHPQPGLSSPALGAPPLPHVALAREQMARVRAEMERACVPSTRHRMAIRLAKYQHFDAAGLFVGQLIDAVVGQTRFRLAAFEAREEQITPDRGGFMMIFRWRADE